MKTMKNQFLGEDQMVFLFVLFFSVIINAQCLPKAE